MKNKIVIFVFVLSMMLILVSCQQLNNEDKAIISSFKDLLNTIPENVNTDDNYGGWALTVPDGDERFIWIKDFSKSPFHDVLIEFDSKPFVDAGLDISKLPTNIVLNNKIMVGVKLGNESLTYNGEATPLDSFKYIIEIKPNQIVYHSELDHYGVNLGNGNIFSWAKDMLNNDSDIQFLLDSKMLTDAGVNPTKVIGWEYKKTTVKDSNSNETEIYKFIKSFNIK